MALATITSLAKAIHQEAEIGSRRVKDLPLLERKAGLVKGYVVVIIVLAVLLVFISLAWLLLFYFLKKKLTQWWAQKVRNIPTNLINSVVP